MIKRTVFVTRMLILLAAVVALPCHAFAWQITATATPATTGTPAVATAVPTTDEGVTVGKLTTVSDSDPSVVFTLGATPANYKLTSVMIDGKRVYNSALDAAVPVLTVHRTVQSGSNAGQILVNHSIVAGYTADASYTFTIKSIDAAGGWISKSQKVANNGSATFTIVANLGSTLSDVLVDGVSTGDVDGSVTISNVTANHTIKPVFTPVKSLAAVLSIPPSYTIEPGTTFAVIGNTKPNYTAGVTYTWAGSCTVGAADETKPGVSKVVVTAPAAGATCTVSLVVAADGLTSVAKVATITGATQAKLPGAFNCIDCHDGVGGPDNSTYVGSTHALTDKNNGGNVTCKNCHNPNDNLSHAYKPLAQITCGTSSCHTAPTHGDVATNNCSTCHDKHSLQVGTSEASCSACHGNPPGTKILGVSTYTHTSSSCADCHSVPQTVAATAPHRDGKIEILTNDTACAACHLYPPASHGSYSNVVAGTSPNCSTCHTYTDFNGATHNNGVAEQVTSCSACHGNPPQVLTVAKSGHTGQHLNVTNCDMCHGAGAADGTSSNHKNGTVNTLKSGAPHFNNVTSGMYPAAYVTSTSTCANCHNANANNATIRGEWAASGHANTTALPWIDYDFKTRVDGCARCHTTTGFIAYSTAKVTAAWGTASDKTKEVLTCVGCHSDVANGVVRTVTPNKPFADEQTFTNADVGTSNICMDCHSGRNNGTTIQAKVTAGANFGNLSFVSPHYLTAGGSLQGKSGFSFPGRTYAALSDNAHSKAGTLNSNGTGSDGPCVACHMSATAKHTFSPVTDTNGTITVITATSCANCHTDSVTFNAGVLDAKKVAFTNALAVLKAALADKGIVVTDNYPYVANKNWGTGQAGANVMGAAFNYKLFVTEPGAYAHNPAYAKQLISDSIEAVATGGTVTGSDVSEYVNNLVDHGVTADQVSSYNTFKNVTSSCASCHSFPPATASHATATTSPINCANCHIYTGMGGATHNNGSLDFGAMSCTSCHPNLSSSHAVHVGNLPTLVTAYGGTDTSFMNNNTDSSGYKFGCVTCHPSSNANHKNGTIVLNGNGFAGTTKSNITCASAACHADGKGAFVTSPNWYGTYTGDRCAMCHSAAPTTGSHTAHINNGIHEGSSGITYTATVSCAKCHASSVDSAKNINFLNHINGVVNVAFVAASEVSKAQISAASFNAYSTVWTRTGATDTSKLPLSAGSFVGGTCSTIACHNNGTTPAWGSGAISCVACHSNL